MIREKAPISRGLHYSKHNMHIARVLIKMNEEARMFSSRESVFSVRVGVCVIFVLFMTLIEEQRGNIFSAADRAIFSPTFTSQFGCNGHFAA